MKIAKTFSEIKDLVDDNKTVALVPTMGALHEGHLSLVRLAKKLAGVVIVTIFVNGAQFSPGEDYKTYPRDLEADSKLLEKEGVDIVFAPSEKEVYPKGLELPDFTDIPDIFSDLIGETRPRYFEGVGKILYRFFDQIPFDYGVFGQKDFQQDVFIDWLIEKYFPEKQLIIAPISREKSGLARSSRNEYLTQEQKEKASVLNKILLKAKELFEKGETRVEKMQKFIEESLLAEPFVKSIQYVSIRDKNSFEKQGKATTESIILIAVNFAGILLIDNIALDGG